MFSATITGRLGRDPVTRQAGQSTVCDLSVATDHGYGEKKITTWIAVQIWGKSGENAAARLQKGATAAFSGDVYIRKYTNRDGLQKEVLTMEARTWEAIGPAQPPQQRPQQPPPPQNERRPPKRPAPDPDAYYGGDDETPF